MYSVVPLCTFIPNQWMTIDQSAVSFRDELRPPCRALRVLKFIFQFQVLKFTLHLRRRGGPAGIHVAMRCRCCLKRYGRNKKQFFLQSRDIRALRTCSRNAYSLGGRRVRGALALEPSGDGPPVAADAVLCPAHVCMMCPSRLVLSDLVSSPSPPSSSTSSSSSSESEESDDEEDPVPCPRSEPTATMYEEGGH